MAALQPADMRHVRDDVYRKLDANPIIDYGELSLAVLVEDVLGALEQTGYRVAEEI